MNKRKKIIDSAPNFIFELRLMHIEQLFPDIIHCDIYFNLFSQTLKGHFLHCAADFFTFLYSRKIS